MSFAKPLCVFCERPAADGFVQAFNVDKEKPQNWLLNICGYEFAEEIEDHDLICYFCIWHAEFLEKHGLNFGTDCWWPQDLDYLDDAAKELRKSYFEGKIEQCWVQLDQAIDDAEEGSGTEYGPQTEQKMMKCLYCDKSYKLKTSLAHHVKNAHKNAIRCDNRSCATYFHSNGEKEEHVTNFHETPKERKIIQCCFCEKEFQANCSYHQHVRHVHTEYPVNCSFHGCIKYFKTEDEKKSHFDSAHKEEDEAKVHECKYCEHRSKTINNLEKHIAAKHLPKTIKCKKCDKLFSTMNLLKIHDRRNHSFKICSICDEEVTSRNICLHLKKQNCRRCKNKFDCLGLFQTHKESCKRTRFECDKCAKTFQESHRLNYHVRRMHRDNSWRGLQYKNLGLKCTTCKMFFKNAPNLKIHLKYQHSAATLKQCAHCSKRFSRLMSLKYHLAMRHNLIESHFECDLCMKKFFRKSNLSNHIQFSHLNRTRRNCTICGKEMLMRSMEKHMLHSHDKL